MQVNRINMHLEGQSLSFNASLFHLLTSWANTYKEKQL